MGPFLVRLLSLWLSFVAVTASGSVMEPDPSLSVDDAFDAVVRDGAANDIGTLIYVLTFGITTAITVYAIYDTFRAMVDGQIDKTGFSIYVVRALAMLMMLHILLQFILAK